MSIFITIFHIVSSIVLILVVLLQAGKEGLGGTFGGGGGASETVFGNQSNEFLTRFTTIMAVIFMISSLWLAIRISKDHKSIVVTNAVTEVKKVTEPAKEAANSPASEEPVASSAVPNSSEPKATPSAAPAAKAVETESAPVAAKNASEATPAS